VGARKGDRPPLMPIISKDPIEGKRKRSGKWTLVKVARNQSGKRSPLCFIKRRGKKRRRCSNARPKLLWGRGEGIMLDGVENQLRQSGCGGTKHAEAKPAAEGRRKPEKESLTRRTEEYIKEEQAPAATGGKAFKPVAGEGG